jgi:hypothetical protein
MFVNAAGCNAVVAGGSVVLFAGMTLLVPDATAAVPNRVKPVAQGHPLQERQACSAEGALVAAQQKRYSPPQAVLEDSSGWIAAGKCGSYGQQHDKCGTPRFGLLPRSEEAEAVVAVAVAAADAAGAVWGTSSGNGLRAHTPHRGVASRGLQAVLVLPLVRGTAVLGAAGGGEGGG